ncbi:ATP-dependent nuclease [Brevibacillus thermoruber]|uniref:ATP-dependent nuclease n=1 Tax=Brevibacillus thermoruber TaxID=33942 RepID=UPI000414C54E|nr:AAA family ATPase [Brevibacillus thermoruber]
MQTREIARISDQYQQGLWPQFLESIEINGLRGWSGQTINFNFPVVAIAGENGSGKSTVLKSIACAYENVEKNKTYYPSTFFISTHWDTIEGVTLSYRIRQGTSTHSFSFKKNAKWSYPEKRYKRDVYIFDISRTLPLDATAGYAKIAKQATGEIANNQISEEYRNWLSYILHREYKNARFAKPDVDNKKEIGLLEREFGEISQFHQGAGEDTTLDLVQALQSIPNNSLLIIDEVEASLHPKAQRRLIRFLLWFSRQKRVQIILSTHSPYVLQELPKEARILLHPSPTGINVVYGISPEFAMSRLDEDDQPELQLFVEDKSSEVMIREIIRSTDITDDIIRRLSFIDVGPANVVRLLGALAINKKLPYKALGVLDGDCDESPGCIKLPGDSAPEIVVFKGLKEKNWGNLPERFGMGAGNLFTVLEEVMLEPDHHTWTRIVGDKLRTSSNSVWETMVKEWVQICLADDYKESICTVIKDMLV